MRAHPGWLVLLVLCVGCHSLTPNPTRAQHPPPAEPNPAARQCWEEGQKAMRQGQPASAIALYEQSLAMDPTLTRNHLSLAAAYLEKGDETGACVHLAGYVSAHPESLLVRVHHAELLWRLKRGPEARAAFESVVADAQDDLSPTHLIHCHSRLMQAGEAEANEYDEHLHRGIGLYLLARERAGAGPGGELSVEGLLCRSAAELTLARIQRPDEARPCWYLYRVWVRLSQRQPAQRWLREAGNHAPFSYLTPAEQRGLELACRDAGR